MFAEMLPLLVFTTFAGLAAGAYAAGYAIDGVRAGRQPGEPGEHEQGKHFSKHR